MGAVQLAPTRASCSALPPELSLGTYAGMYQRWIAARLATCKQEWHHVYCASSSDYTLGRTHIHVHALLLPGTIPKIATKAIFFSNYVQLTAAATHWLLYSSIMDEGYRGVGASANFFERVNCC